MAKKRLLTGLLPVIILLVVAGFYFLKDSKQFESLKTNNVVTSVTPTPKPFYDMTIPALRSRKYESKLSTQNLISEKGSYNEYLTSYNSDGLKVNGLLTKPTTEMPKDGFPAIVFIHGYIPPTEYRTQERYIAYVDYLAKNRYVVFKIDLRGHDQSEGRAGGGYFGSDYVVDALNAYAALESSDFVNPKKIGLWGHSMAGNIVLRSMAAKPTIPAAVIWAGAVYSYVDQIKYGINDPSYRPPAIATPQQNRRNQIAKLYGRADSGNEFWKEVAPTNYLSDLKGAIEIHHTLDDTVVNIGYSRDLMSLLDKTKVSHQLFEYNEGGHNIASPSFEIAIQRTLEWYDKYLK